MDSRDSADEPTDSATGHARSNEAVATRRTVLRATGGALLGSSVLGTASDVARASETGGREPEGDPSPGAIDWSKYIENPLVVGDGTEPPHAPTTMPYGTLSAARDAERSSVFLTKQWTESTYVRSLDGAWKFHFADDLDGAATDTSGYEEWDSVYVPHSWQMDGYGDAEYSPAGPGFSPNDPPNVPSADNSVGTYKREFPVPEGWASDRQTFLRIGAAKAGYFVWVNGTYVGYKQGSMTPGEFNVTGVVEEGAANTVTIQVIRWTDGTYLEQQDMWRFAGIFRDVHLYSKPDLCVRDVHSVADLNSTYTDGTLELDAAVANYADSRRRATLRAHLFDPSGTEIRTAERSVTVDGGGVASLDGGSTDGVRDRSREANDATVRGDPDHAEGDDGNALDFDGSDDWVDVGSDASLDVTGALTVEAIVEGPERVSDTDVPILTRGNSQYLLRLREGDPQFVVSDGVSRASVRAETRSDWAGNWHRITGVYDGSSLRLYVDGEERAATSHASGIQSTDYAVGVAHNTQETDRYGDIVVDAARIYDRALSADEVADDRTVPGHAARLWLDFDEIRSGSASPITMDVSDVRQWSAENPSLYALGLELVPAGSSSPAEALIDKVGFRTFEIEPAPDGTGDAMLVNGEHVTLAGTNRHDYSLDHGRHVPRERLRKEVELAKRNNVNAIRTAHYPHPVDFYRLADEYGIYVQDEINAEAHNNSSLVVNDYRFDPSFFDRFYRMVERDKNFASINIWSTGNEAGEGPAHRLMAEYVDNRDGTRHLTHQDNGLAPTRDGFGGNAPFADINGLRWGTPSDNRTIAREPNSTKPVVPGEFAPVEGNAGGLLPDFYDVIHEYDQLQGGYIWMWNHHTLNTTRAPPDAGVLTESHRRAAIEDRSIAGQTALVNGSPEATSGAAWPEESEGVSTPDESEQDNDGTVHGDPAHVSGREGKALDLDGEDDWVDAGTDDSLDETGELTLEAVVLGDSDLSGDQPFVVKGDTQYGLKTNDGDLEFFVHDGIYWHTVSAAPPEGWDGGWHTVTGTYDGTALRLFADGAELGITPFAGSINSTGYAVGIGHNTEASGRYSAAVIDSARIYDRALTADEVDTDRQSPDASSVLWYDFETLVTGEESTEAASGPSGTALDLDGIGDWIDANDDDRIDINGELTVEAVIYGDTPDSTDAPIVAKGDTQYCLRFHEGDLQFVVHGDTWPHDDRSPPEGWSGDSHDVTASLPEDWSGSWHAVTGVYDGEALRLYVDGTEIGSSSYDGPVDSNRYRVGIGHNTETDRYADITVDSVRIFDRALSPDEVDADAPDDSTRLWLDFEIREHVWKTPDDTNVGSQSGTIYDDRYTLPTLDVTKQSHRFVRFSPSDLANGEVEVTNAYTARNLDDLDVLWELREDDAVVQRGSLDVDVPPGDTRTLEVGYSRPELRAGSEYFLEISVRLAADEPWADAGHEVALEVFEVPWDAPSDPTVSADEMEPVSYTESGSTVTVSGSDFTYAFDTDLGRFTSLRRHGAELLNEGPQLNAWREPVSPNETSSWGDAESEDWYAAGLDRQEHTVLATMVDEPDPSAVRIAAKTEVSAPDRSEAFVAEYLYHVLGSGDVVTRLRVTPNAEMRTTVSSYLPKYGLQLRMPESFDRFEWFGRGPGETYPDKRWHERIDRHSGSVADQFVEYLPTQDYGNKCDARYAAVTDDDGVGLLVHDLPETETMNVSVQEFTDMATVEYSYQLEHADGVVFNVDYDVSGVGGIRHGTREAYRVDPETVEFVYAFRPISDADADPLQLSRRDLPYSDATLSDVDVEDA